MSVIADGEFKTTCLHILDQVKKTRESVTVTKRGKPVVPRPVKSPPQADSIRHLRPIESATRGQ